MGFLLPFYSKLKCGEWGGARYCHVTSSIADISFLPLTSPNLFAHPDTCILLCFLSVHFLTLMSYSVFFNQSIDFAFKKDSLFHYSSSSNHTTFFFFCIAFPSCSYHTKCICFYFTILSLLFSELLNIYSEFILKSVGWLV